MDKRASGQANSIEMSVLTCTVIEDILAENHTPHTLSCLY